jgi:hypothetical protein
VERRIGVLLAKLFVSQTLEVESMNSDADARSPEDCLTTLTYTSDGTFIMTSERAKSLRVTNYNDPAGLRAEQVQLDRQKRLITRTRPGGKTKHFGDSPKQ